MNLARQIDGRRVRLERLDGDTRSVHDIVASSYAWMGGGGSAPPPRDIYSETAGNLQAQVDLAPKQFAAEAQFQPQYTALQLQGLQDYLMGTAAGTRQQSVVSNVRGYRNSQTGEFVAGSTAPAWRAPSGGRGSNDGVGAQNPWLPYTEQQTNYSTIDTPAQRGLLDIYEHDLQPASDRITANSMTAQRASDIADVANLGPQATAAWKAANPQQSQLLDEINRQTMDQLNQGANIDPDLQRQLSQSLRGAQAARGMGTGRGDAGMEAYYSAQEGNNLRQQRLTNAGNVAELNQRTTIDPFQAILGRPGANLAQSNQFAGGASGAYQTAKPQLFNSQNAYASDLANTNFNAASANYISGQNNAAAMNGAAVSGGSALAAAGVTAIFAF